MTHRYQVGQTVSVRGSAILPGPFRIVRLPLSESGVPQYRVTSIADGHDRVFPETAMRLLPAAANSTQKLRSGRRDVRSNRHGIDLVGPLRTLGRLAQRSATG
jgi:hypothetical protein